MTATNQQCGCVIATRYGKKVACLQPKAAGKNECYLHAKYFEGLTTPARSADIDMSIDGGGIFATSEDIVSITNTHGKTKTFA